jgi:hypothetical protein
MAFLLHYFFQKELEKQKRIKRNQELETVAKEHYKMVLLRNKGLEPWKRLRMQSKQNIQVHYPAITPQIRKWAISNSTNTQLVF